MGRLISTIEKNSIRIQTKLKAQKMSAIITVSDLGVPFVKDGQPFLDLILVIAVVQHNFPTALKFATEIEGDGGKGRYVPYLKSICGQDVDFDLRFADKLTYRPGDAIVGWLDDLEPLFRLYRLASSLVYTSN